MKTHHLTLLATLVLAGVCTRSASWAFADEKGNPSVISNPHRGLELDQFVHLSAVRNDIQLTEEQVGKINAIAELIRNRLKRYEFEQTMRDAEVDGIALYQGLRHDLDLFHALAEAALSPEQLARLKQLASQHLTRNPRGAFGLLSPAMKKELNITDDQARALHEKSGAMAEQLRQREEELKLELEKLRTKMRAELVESLNPQQKESVKRLWGPLVPIPQ
jgi:DNA anti-recombination protein RmuC